MNIPYVMKRCSKCGRWLVANSVNFNKDKYHKDGLRSYCKECAKEYRKQNKDKISAYRKEYYEQNKDKELVQHKEYYEQNKDKISAYRKEYREQNKEKESAQEKKYREANKEKVAEQKKKYLNSPKGQVVAFNHHHKRRTQKQTQGNGITTEQWRECMSFFNWECAYSGETLAKETRSLDHIEPLNKGGANEIWNVVPMIRSLNSSKCDKEMLDWYQEQDFYSEERLQKIYEWQEYAYNKWHKEEIV